MAQVNTQTPTRVHFAVYADCNRSTLTLTELKGSLLSEDELHAASVSSAPQADGAIMWDYCGFISIDSATGQVDASGVFPATLVAPQYSIPTPANTYWRFMGRANPLSVKPRKAARAVHAVRAATAAQGV
jgi:hypothetical protein